MISIPTLYRDENGNRLTTEQLLRLPAAYEQWHPYALTPEPDKPYIVGTIRGLPVYLVTDVGGTLDPDVRSVAFKSPKDDRVHVRSIRVPCTIPVRCPGERFYLVHSVTIETVAAMDPEPKPVRFRLLPVGAVWIGRKLWRAIC